MSTATSRRPHRSGYGGVRALGRLSCSVASACAIALAFVWVADARAEEEAFDPLRGIEPDGRIPKIERPADLPNPERWRYIPEGRIKPGSVFERLFVTSFIAPIFFKSSDAGWGGGIGVGDIDFREQRRREFAVLFASYSEERQQSYGMVWRRALHHVERPGGGILQEERSFLRARAIYSRTRTRRFYGFGSETVERDESSYTDDRFVAELGAEYAWPEPGSDLVVMGAVRAELHDLSEGIVKNAADTMAAFPDVFARDQRRNMGWTTAGLRYDTRDSQSNPYRGWSVGGGVDAALIQSGGDVGAVFTFDATRVIPVPGFFHRARDFHDEENPPTDTLLIGLRSQLTAGDLPFYSLPSLGGRGSMRGFIAGRFRDRASWYGSAEYRFWVIQRGLGLSHTFRIERIGAAIFYEPGSVASDGGELLNASVQHSYGFSLIFSLERLFPFRMDFGFSKDGFALNVGAGLSF